MDLAIAAAVGWVVGTLGCYLMHYQQMSYLRKELTGTHAQIAHAVLQEGTFVPPLTEEIQPAKPLPPELQSVVDEWEDAESRAVEEGKIRRWLSEDWGVKAILRQYEANPEVG